MIPEVAGVERVLLGGILLGRVDEGFVQVLCEFRCWPPGGVVRAW